MLIKGHADSVLYSCLATRGFFDKKELLTLNKLNSISSSHVDRLKPKGDKYKHRYPQVSEGGYGAYPWEDRDNWISHGNRW